MKLKSGVIGLIAAAGTIFALSAFAQDAGQQNGMQQQDQMMDQQGEPSAMSPETIKQVQQALNNKGYDAGAADGNWGTKTENAVKDFQESQGMQGTGQLDQQTLAALGISGGAGAGGGEQQDSGAGGQQDGMYGGEQQGTGQ